MTAASRTLRIASDLYVGCYVDGRQGAVVMLGNHVAHLTPQQCRELVQKLQECTG